MKKIIAWLTVMFLLVPFALLAQWNNGYGCFGHGWGFHRYFGYGGGIMMLLTIIVIVFLVIFAVKMIRSQGNPFMHNDAMNILKTRYAKGEITKEQFEEMKKNIM